MNGYLLGLDTVLVGQAILLASIGIGAARRYSDSRFALISVALVAFAAVGLTAIVDQLFPGSIPGADLGFTSALLLIAAELLVYLSLIVPRPPARRATSV